MTQGRRENMSLLIRSIAYEVLKAISGLVETGRVSIASITDALGVRENQSQIDTTQYRKRSVHFSAVHRCLDNLFQTVLGAQLTESTLRRSLLQRLQPLQFLRQPQRPCASASSANEGRLKQSAKTRSLRGLRAIPSEFSIAKLFRSRRRFTDYQLKMCRVESTKHQSRPQRQEFRT